MKPPGAPRTARGARRLAGRVARQLAGISVLDMATRLAAQAFLTALPLLFVLASYCPDSVREQLRASLRELLGAGGAAMRQIDAVYAGTARSPEAWGAASAAVALVSATALTRVLQRLCERSWHLPRAGARTAVWRWVLWLLVWAAALVFQGVLRNGFGAGAVLGVPLKALAAVGLWWWTQHLLLAGRVRWLPLLPGALLTGVGTTAFAATSGLWMPRSLQQSVDRFGLLGSVFTLLSWLILFCAVVVVGIAVGQVLAYEERLRRRLGPPEGLEAEPGAL
ncbi:YhjD/YihY/BrkB family envelope integrity protein [Streptomyces sp. ODS28]|uniref:YhjD/YihY/BrkB family envelope integrity protein n=1 Tax=Streptomyces sp. ODS28 TaxID=3136688 RepID=UPI0031E7B624